MGGVEAVFGGVGRQPAVREIAAGFSLVLVRHCSSVRYEPAAVFGNGISLIVCEIEIFF